MYKIYNHKIYNYKFHKNLETVIFGEGVSYCGVYKIKYLF